MSYKGQCVLASTLIALLGCSCTDRQAEVPATTEAVTPPAFLDVAQAAGITHTHHKPILDAKLSNIMSWMASVGAAAAAGDYDRDGWIDLYVTDSRKGEPNRLYHNNQDGTFSDLAPTAGLADWNGDDGTSMDAVWGDYNGDGWPDLYLVRWGRDVLFRNRGDGTFEDQTAELFRRRDGSQGMDWANGNAVVFFDYDLDGRLDLYVGNYFQPVDLWHLKDTFIMHESFETARNGGPNFLFRQQANGQFEEVGEKLGLDDVGWALAIGSADLDNDGWPDLYCANDFGPDRLYLNNGDGSFTDATESAIGFDTKKGMNVDFGDFNNDGWLDIFVANITTAEYLQEGGMLWHNNGPGAQGELTMTDIALEAGTFDGGWGWGAKFLDYDNDGDLDLVAANGFISAGEGSYWYDLASWTVTGDRPTDSRNWPEIGTRSFSGYERMRVWRNDGLSSFTERGRELGLESKRDGRGVVVFDYDNDGDLDLFIANQNQPPHLYQNMGRDLGHWLVLALERDPATGINPDAIGARVTLVMEDGERMIRERDGGNGYAGQSDPRLHFGLGDQGRVALLEVRWPDGGVQYLEDVEADQLLTIRQDPARYAANLQFDISKPQHAPTVNEKIVPVPEIASEELDRQLAAAEKGLRGNPEEGWVLPSAYRRLAATYGEHKRAVDFLKGLVDDRPTASGRIELAAAYVDQIPTCGGLAAVVCKGTLARKGLGELDLVIEADPDSWIALYARGMNHLHWPRALRHSDDAARDLRRCIELQELTNEIRPYFLKPHVALGDAMVKAGDYEEARRVWQRALSFFPDSSELVSRLAIEGTDDLLDFVEDQRSLEQAIDTDLSFFSVN